MATIRKSITFTEKLSEWVQRMVATGDYANESEYLRDLVRRDRAKNAEFLHLKAEIQKGLDSPMSTKTVEDIWEEAEQRHKKKNEL